VVFCLIRKRPPAFCFNRYGGACPPSLTASPCSAATHPWAEGRFNEALYEYPLGSCAEAFGCKRIKRKIRSFILRPFEEERRGDTQMLAATFFASFLVAQERREILQIVMFISLRAQRNEPKKGHPASASPSGSLDCV